MAIRHMFKPIRIGNIEIKNRIVQPAYGTGLGGGTINDDFIAYHEQRAKGGVGLIILEGVSADYQTSPSRMNPHDEMLVDGYRTFATAMRPYGTKVFQQIVHLGHNSRPPSNYGATSSPSDIPGASTPYGISTVPAPMSYADISRTVEGFAACAAACKEGDLDGVEIHCAHSYLIMEFLSEIMNRRTDRYGGSFENRMRFPLEVLRAVRTSVGKDFVVGIRVGPEDLPGGVNVPECIAFVERVQDEGLIDFVSVSYGGYHQVQEISAGMYAQTGYELPTSAPITAVSKVPTMVSGRFRTVEEADQVVHEGLCDLVAMARAHIADPYIVTKTLEGRQEEIRACIGCNQGCIANRFVIGHISCAINPSAGYERLLSEDRLEKTPQRRKILVVGGGPAGMEAARVAALRGHQVILAEATPDLGGMINVARLAPRRGGIADIINWQANELQRLNVEIRLNTYVEASDVLEEQADVVIVATGSRPRLDGFQSMVPSEIAPGHDMPHVVSSYEVLMDKRRPVSGSAVVFDDLGHYEAIAAAEALIDAGSQVTYVTSHIAFAPRVEPAGMTGPALRRLARSQGQFRIEYRSKIISVSSADVEIAPLYATHQIQKIPASLLVWVNAGRSNRDLLDAFEDQEIRVIPVGDAKAPRFLQTAIREGHLAAREI